MEIADLIFILPILLFFWVPCLFILVKCFKGLRRARAARGQGEQGKEIRPRRRAVVSIVISVMLMMAGAGVALFYLYVEGLAGYTPAAEEIFLDILMFSPLFLSAAALTFSILWWRSAHIKLIVWIPLLVSLAYIPSSHAEAAWWGGGALFAFLVGYLLFLIVTVIASITGLIRAVLRYRRGEKSGRAVVLATLFTVPNVLFFLLFLLVGAIAEGLLNSYTYTVVMAILFVLPLAWLIAAIAANKKS